MRQVTTLLALGVMLAASPAAAQGPSPKLDAEVMNYRLSMEKLRKLPQVQRALNAAHAKNPKIFDSIDEERAAARKNKVSLTVAQMAAMLDRRPEARSAFASAGWNAREWMLTSEAMGNAVTWIETKKGTLSGPPPATNAQKANVALLEANQAEFQKILEELDQLTDELINQ
jgi:hypothetical protein